MIILGQTYKTLPFIVWLDKYQAYVGKFKTPVPRELYSNKIANYQFYTYLLALSLMVIGIIIAQPQTLLIGSIIMVLTALLNLLNVLMIVTHKIKIEDFPTKKQQDQ